MDLSGKVAIVTGASSGIGLAVSRQLAKKGVKVALVARSKIKINKIAKTIPESLPVVADMTKVADIEAMISNVSRHFGQIDILVNNAGQGYDTSVEKTNIDTFRNIFELDVIGPVIAMKKVIPIMRQQGGGVIMNISSGTALMQLPNMGMYSSLKKALAQISLTARLELAKDNIAVGVVFPYITKTNFEKHTIKAKNLKWERSSRKIRPPDSAKYIAKKTVEGIQKESAEVYAHEWMKR